jgi:hypothetical protein
MLCTLPRSTNLGRFVVCTGDLAILQHDCNSIHEIPGSSRGLSTYTGPGSEVLKLLMTSPVSVLQPDCRTAAHGLALVALSW